MHIAIVTAGGAGMFCGSCLHDNTWAKALREDGHRLSFIPLYTPVRVDDVDQTTSPVFFGGINVYLEERFHWWRSLPRWMTRWLDRPWLLNLVARGSVSTNAAELGALTESMLLGSEGPHAAQVHELVEYVELLQPDVTIFSNALLSGAVPALRRATKGAILCMLQGDDIFLDDLPEPYQSRVSARIAALAPQYDALVTHSQYYQDEMRSRLKLEGCRFAQLPLAIDVHRHSGRPRPALRRPPRIGYFARVCEAKGLRELVRACLLLAGQSVEFELVVGGWLGKDHQAFFEEVQRLACPLGTRFQFAGSPATHEEKVALLQTFDVFALPAVYREPKGLPVLEAWANGVPVVLTNHGALPELVASTGGGLLVPPRDPVALAETLKRLLQDDQLRFQLAEQGYRQTRERHALENLVAESNRLFAELSPAANASSN